MALIRTFHKLDGERTSVHDEVEARYSEFQRDGVGFVQINTYGKPDRQMPGKVSQSIQLDRGAAIQLVNILRKAFAIS